MERFERTLKIRVIVSAILYAAFVVLGLVAAITDQAFVNALVVLLVSSFLLIPRQALPRDYKPDLESEAERERAEKAAHVQKWLNYARLAYFLVAIVILMVLPELF